MKVLFTGDIYLKHPISLDKKITQLFSEHNIVIGNLEAPVIESTAVPSPKAGPHLCHNRQQLKDILSLNITHFSLANNHIGDYGIEGINLTSTLLKKRFFGAGVSPMIAYKPLVFVDQNICFISVADHEFGISSGYDNQPWGAAWMDSLYVEMTLAEARRKKQRIVLIIHGGVEEIPAPLESWRKKVQSFANKVDLIICHHPHVIQGFEVIGNTSVFYSLGNFIFTGYRKESRGLLVSAHFTEKNIVLHIYEVEQIGHELILCENSTLARERSKLLLSSNNLLSQVWSKNYKPLLFLSVLALFLLEPLESFFDNTFITDWVKKARRLLLLHLTSSAHQTAMIDYLKERPNEKK